MSAAAAPARAADGETAVVVIRSLDALIASARAVIKDGLPPQADREMISQQFENGLKSLAPDGQFPGLDGAKPHGIFFTLNEQNPAESAVIVAVPVTDKDKFLSFLGNFGVRAGPADGDIVPLETPGLPVFAKFSGGYAFASNVKGALATLPDVGKLSAVADKGLLTVTAHLDRIPASFKDQIKSALDAQRAQKAPKNPGEELGQKLVFEAVEAVLADGQAFTYLIDLNPQTGALAFEESISFKPGSPSAGKLSAFTAGADPLAFLADKAAVYGRARVPVSAELSEFFAKAFWEGFDKSDKDDAERKEKARPHLDKIAGALRKDLVGGSAALAPEADGTFALTATVIVKDAAQIEEALRGLYKDVPPKEDKVEVKLDADKEGDTAVHLIHNPKEDGKDLFKALGGTANVAFAFKGETVFIGLGRDAVAAVKAAVAEAGKAAAPPAGAPAVLVDVSLLKLAPVVETGSPGYSEHVKKVFGSAPAGSDRIRLTVSGGTALTLRAEASVRVFALAPVPAKR
jgi:hypothetical protein